MIMKTSGCYLSIVIPALNEGGRLGSTLDALKLHLETESIYKNKNIEVVVVAANASDNTHDVAAGYINQIPNFKILKPGKKLGKGRDVQYGMLRSRGKYILFMDADLATPLRHIPIFLSTIEKDSSSEVLIAVRNLRNHHNNYLRRGLSNTGNVLYRLLGGVWVSASQCGFKLFTKRSVKICFTKQTIMGWGFDMEILAIAKQNNIGIKQMPVNDWKHIPDGPFERGDVGKILSNTLQSLGDLFLIMGHRVRRDYLK